MKELLVFRHAKAVDAGGAPNDRDRDLKQKGERSASAMGVLLSERKLVPDLILTSDALRARRTAELCEAQLPSRVDVLAIPALYDCEPADYVELIDRQPDVVARLMVVGHNPTLEELIERLTGAGLRLKAGALARIRLGIPSWRNVSNSPNGSVEDLFEV